MEKFYDRKNELELLGKKESPQSRMLSIESLAYEP